MAQGRPEATPLGRAGSPTPQSPPFPRVTPLLRVFLLSGGSSRVPSLNLIHLAHFVPGTVLGARCTKKG